MTSIGESATRRKTDSMDVDMDFFNGLFCAEGSYKQFKSFAMPSNEEDRRGTSDSDTVDNWGYHSFTTYNGTIAKKQPFFWQNMISESLHDTIYQLFLLQTIIPLVFGRATS